MTTLDLLERAHAHLTELKSASTPGPWTQGRKSSWMGDQGVVVQGSIKTAKGCLTWDDHAGEVFLPADSDLIVTLHRTLDAQLAILTSGLYGARNYSESHPGYETADIAADLARAILGEDA